MSDQSPSVEEYFKELVRHDWFYHYSDDHRAYTKGQDNSRRIQAVCQENELLSRMYSEYVGWINAVTKHGREQTLVKEPVVEDYL
jgi:hypothetical protein